ncbi:MAG: VOC family protein [Bacteroidota bacterium]
MNQSSLRPFHLAFPIKDIESTRQFYQEVMGCKIGRSAETWIDFDFFGHQLSAHVVPSKGYHGISKVDGKDVPISHWGIVLAWDDWMNLAERLKQHEVTFVIEPYIRFKGEVGEQATMFFLDPSGNPLEFKAFKQDEQLFAS